MYLGVGEERLKTVFAMSVEGVRVLLHIPQVVLEGVVPAEERRAATTTLCPHVALFVTPTK